MPEQIQPPDPDPRDRTFGRLAATPGDSRPTKNGSLLTDAELGRLDSEVVVLG